MFYNDSNNVIKEGLILQHNEIMDRCIKCTLGTHVCIWMTVSYFSVSGSRVRFSEQHVLLSRTKTWSEYNELLHRPEMMTWSETCIKCVHTTFCMLCFLSGMHWVFCRYPICRYLTHLADNRYWYTCIFFSSHLIAEINQVSSVVEFTCSLIMHSLTVLNAGIKYKT